MKKDLYIIIGETATGKTALSIDLQEKIRNDIPNAKIEIINSDHTQFYKELNYSVCKIEDKDKKGIAHHMIDNLSIFREADLKYNVNDFIKDCTEKIKEIIKRDNTPVIVGGSHYYIYQLLYKNNPAQVEINNKKINKYIKISEVMKTIDIKINSLKLLQYLYEWYKIKTILKFIFKLKINYLKSLPYPLRLNNSDFHNTYRLEHAIEILKDKNYIQDLTHSKYTNNQKSILWEKYNIKIIYTNKYKDLIKDEGIKYKDILKSRWHNQEKEKSNLSLAFIEYKNIRDKLKISKGEDKKEIVNNIFFLDNNNDKDTTEIEDLALVFKVFKNLNINETEDFYQNYDKILDEIITFDYKYAKRQHLYIKKYFWEYLDQ